MEDRYSIDPYTTDDSEHLFLSESVWRPYFADNAELEIKYLEIEKNTEILLIKATPEDPSSKTPVLFIPGWFSVISSWNEMLTYLSKQTIVYYLETREKTSSKLTDKNVDFSIERIAADLNKVVGQLDDDIEHMVVVASSLGGTMMIKYLADYQRHPLYTFFIGPNAKLKVPFIVGPLVLRMPLFMFRATISYVKWHIIRFRLDPEKDPEQVQKYLQVLRLAIPWRMKSSAKAIVKYDGWKDLKNITSPTVLVAAQSDKLHKAELTLEMKNSIRSAKFLEFSTNKEVHSVKMAEIVLKVCNQDYSVFDQTE